MIEKKCKTCGGMFTGHHKKLYCKPECIPKRSHKKKSVKEKPTPEVPAPEVPAPDLIPPTQTTTPANPKDKPEGKPKDKPEGEGESEKKPFRGFFYD